MVFQVRRRSSWDVSSSITLDHGGLLVIDGLAQSERAHRTVPGLQGLRVNLTCRWVAQHIASCPQAGAVGCVLPSCVQGLAKPGSHGLGVGENKWYSSWGLVLLLLISVTALLVSTWIHIRREHRHSGQRPSARRRTSPLGSCPLGWGTALATVTTSPISQKSVFLFPFLFLFWRENFTLFLKGMFSYVCVLLSMLVAMRDPTPCCHDAYSVGTPQWACWAKGWQKHCEITFSLVWTFFLG